CIAQRNDRLVGGCRDLTSQRGGASGEIACDRSERRRGRSGCVAGRRGDQSMQLVLFRVDRRLIRAPGSVTTSACFVHRMLLQRVELCRGCDLLLDDPFTKPRDSVVFLLPFQPLWGLVALVASGRRVTVRLCHLGYVDHGGNVIAANDVSGALKRLDERGVIPSA